MGRFFRWILFLALIGFGVFWWLTRPSTVDEAAFDALEGDPIAGELVFNAGGCSSCHAAPKSEGEALLVLAGGQEFPSDFGTFVAPNISPSPEGIGDWSVVDLANAMMKGVSPEGAHYYPAFPYTSYRKVAPQDVADLMAYLATLPPSANPSAPHQVGFPFNIRRGLGLWKLLFADKDYVLDAGEDPVLVRGRYLVEALGHCAECHTSRNLVGGLNRSAWLAGAPNPEGQGRIPNITPHESGIAAWSDAELIEYFTSGFTPEFDVAGGKMSEVVGNLSKLPADDRAAIAAYLKVVPPLPTHQ